MCAIPGANNFRRFEMSRAVVTVAGSTRVRCGEPTGHCAISERGGATPRARGQLVQAAVGECFIFGKAEILLACVLDLDITIHVSDRCAKQRAYEFVFWGQKTPVQRRRYQKLSGGEIM